MENKLTKKEQNKQNNILAIQTFKSQGYSVAKTAELLRLSTRTVYRYWNNNDYNIFNKESNNEQEIEQYITKEKYKYQIDKGKDLDYEWNKILSKRKEKAIYTELKNEQGNKIWFVETDKIKSAIEYIEVKAKDDLLKYNKTLFKNYISSEEMLLDSLADESFYSSTIEGAFSTRKVAKELVMNKRVPLNKSEKMIYNNHMALKHGLDDEDEKISEKLMIDMFDLISKDTLDEDECIDKYRLEDVVVRDTKGNIIHEGASVENIQPMIDDLFKFMYSSSINPIIKSAIFHFYFVFIHPFPDGNGRTARATSYIYLVKEGYDIFKHFSISALIAQKKSKYYKSIKDVEDNELDLTYFIEFILEVVSDSIDIILDKYTRKHIENYIFMELVDRDISINSEQKKIIKYILNKENYSATIENYTKKNKKVDYKRVNKDMNYLAEIGILSKSKDGRYNVYSINVIK
ncbi:MAG: Fic family protein [Romboutsia sp.]|uniref:Fic family protein n=1 Tax=Romboutsia sp. TaxID=1965302 RepID=UPI003F41860E